MVPLFTVLPCNGRTEECCADEDAIKCLRNALAPRNACSEWTAFATVVVRVCAIGNMLPVDTRKPLQMNEPLDVLEPLE